MLCFALLCVFGIFVFGGQGMFYMAMLIMLTNTIEYDEWKTGQRNESIIFSVRPFMVKLSGAVQYAEDDDYINRVLYHHYKIGVCPSVMIVHNHQDSFSANIHKKSQDSHSLFAEWLNLNRIFSVRRCYLLYSRRWLRSFIKYDAKSCAYYSNALTLLSQYKKQIKNMRKENKQKKPSWI